MTDQLTKDIEKTSSAIIYPLPPQDVDKARFEMEVYARFMGHLRNVPHSREDIKVLTAIEFTADIMDTSDALVAKTLLDLGLRAPRRSFPATFLEFVDHTIARTNWETGSAPSSVNELAEHWNVIGEGRFENMMRNYYAISPVTMYERV